MKLGYDRFVRVGRYVFSRSEFACIYAENSQFFPIASLKKIAKNILPYTAQAKLSSNEGR